MSPVKAAFSRDTNISMRRVCLRWSSSSACISSIFLSSILCLVIFYLFSLQRGMHTLLQTHGTCHWKCSWWLSAFGCAPTGRAQSKWTHRFLRFSRCISPRLYLSINSSSMVLAVPYEMWHHLAICPVFDAVRLHSSQIWRSKSSRVSNLPVVLRFGLFWFVLLGISHLPLDRDWTDS